MHDVDWLGKACLGECHGFSSLNCMNRVLMLDCNPARLAVRGPRASWNVVYSFLAWSQHVARSCLSEISGSRPTLSDMSGMHIRSDHQPGSLLEEHTLTSSQICYSQHSSYIPSDYIDSLLRLCFNMWTDYDSCQYLSFHTWRLIGILKKSL